MNEEVYSTRDRQVVPFLFTQKEVNLVGTYLIGSTVYFQFEPGVIAQKLANQFIQRKAPLIQPKDLLDAVETFKNKVFELKEMNEEN